MPMQSISLEKITVLPIGEIFNSKMQDGIFEQLAGKLDIVEAVSDTIDKEIALIGSEEFLGGKAEKFTVPLHMGYKDLEGIVDGLLTSGKDIFDLAMLDDKVLGNLDLSSILDDKELIALDFKDHFDFEKLELFKFDQILNKYDEITSDLIDGIDKFDAIKELVPHGEADKKKVKGERDLEELAHIVLSAKTFSADVLETLTKTYLSMIGESILAFEAAMYGKLNVLQPILSHSGDFLPSKVEEFIQKQFTELIEKYWITLSVRSMIEDILNEVAEKVDVVVGAVYDGLRNTCKVEPCAEYLDSFEEQTIRIVDAKQAVVADSIALASRKILDLEAFKAFEKYFLLN